MGAKIYVTGMFKPRSDRGPLMAVTLKPDLVAKLLDALDKHPDGTLAIWPTREPREGGPTHQLVIEEKFIGGGRGPDNRSGRVVQPEGDDGVPF